MGRGAGVIATTVITARCGSLSWRLTAPARVAAERVRAARGRRERPRSGH
jgi:hypothetical protein